MTHSARAYLGVDVLLNEVSQLLQGAVLVFRWVEVSCDGGCNAFCRGLARGVDQALPLAAELNCGTCESPLLALKPPACLQVSKGKPSSVLLMQRKDDVGCVVLVEVTVNEVLTNRAQARLNNTDVGKPDLTSNGRCILSTRGEQYKLRGWASLERLLEAVLQEDAARIVGNLLRLIHNQFGDEDLTVIKESLQSLLRQNKYLEVVDHIADLRHACHSNLSVKAAEKVRQLALDFVKQGARGNHVCDAQRRSRLCEAVEKVGLQHERLARRGRCADSNCLVASCELLPNVDLKVGKDRWFVVNLDRVSMLSTQGLQLHRPWEYVCNRASTARYEVASREVADGVQYLSARGANKFVLRGLHQCVGDVLSEALHRHASILREDDCALCQLPGLARVDAFHLACKVREARDLESLVGLREAGIGAHLLCKRFGEVRH